MNEQCAALAVHARHAAAELGKGALEGDIDERRRMYVPRELRLPLFARFRTSALRMQIPILYPRDHHRHVIVPATVERQTHQCPAGGLGGDARGEMHLDLLVAHVTR